MGWQQPLRYQRRYRVKHIKIEATENSPKIILDATKGLIHISGDSYPENTFEFYEMVLEWLQNYFNSPLETTTVKLNLSYFNSSTVQILFEIFDIFQENREKTTFVIEWYYDKEDSDWRDDYDYFAEEFTALDIRPVGEERP